MAKEEIKKPKKVAKTNLKVDVLAIQTAKTPEEILKERKSVAKLEESADSNSRELNQAKPATIAKPVKAKPAPKPVRSRLERRGKNYRSAHKLVDKSKVYSIDEAAELIGKTSYVKFDASVELHVNLGVDPKQSDQLVRGTISLPHGSGKSQRVAVFALEPSELTEAKTAGADVVGGKELLADIEKGKLNFEILITAPTLMPQLGKVAKILGPKGMMPNPKSGTVTTDIAKTVKELKGGRVEFRVDPSGIIHQTIGKVSYKPLELAANIKTFLGALAAAKPASVKEGYIKRVWLSTSMGPSLRLNPVVENRS